MVGKLMAIDESLVLGGNIGNEVCTTITLLDTLHLDRSKSKPSQWNYVCMYN